jgi:3D (Asp-Asp-Asp) domain-containing protein
MSKLLVRGPEKGFFCSEVFGTRIRLGHTWGMSYGMTAVTNGQPRIAAIPGRPGQIAETRRPDTPILISHGRGNGLHLVLARQTVSAAHPPHRTPDMPLRARHRRRVRTPAVALLGAVAGGVLLVACSTANPPSAAPPGTTRPAPSHAPTSTKGARRAELGIFEVSCHTGKGVTASGRPSSRETVSVDPRVVPLGTRLVIDKVGARVAADTGGAIKGRRLDIWEPSAATCTRFGRRQLRVWLAP